MINMGLLYDSLNCGRQINKNLQSIYLSFELKTSAGRLGSSYIWQTMGLDIANFQESLESWTVSFVCSH